MCAQQPSSKQPKVAHTNNLNRSSHTIAVKRVPLDELGIAEEAVGAESEADREAGLDVGRLVHRYVHDGLQRLLVVRQDQAAERAVEQDLLVCCLVLMRCAAREHSEQNAKGT